MPQGPAPARVPRLSSNSTTRFQAQSQDHIGSTPAASRPPFLVVCSFYTPTKGNAPEGSVTQELSVWPSHSSQQRLQPALSTPWWGASRCPRPCVWSRAGWEGGSRRESGCGSSPGRGSLAQSTSCVPDTSRRVARAVIQASKRQAPCLAELGGQEGNASVLGRAAGSRAGA